MGGIVASILALFLPVITYVDKGVEYAFNIVDFIGMNEAVDTVLAVGYQGPDTVDIDGGLAAFLGILTAAAIVCAVIGLITLRAQKPNTVQFALTVVGLVGVLIPSAVAIAVVLFNGKYYAGDISLGIAPIIAPIAVALSIAAVFRRKNKVAEQLKREVMAEGLMYEGRNLD